MHPRSHAQEAAQQLLPLVAAQLQAAGGRYAIVAHSMGCWAAFELLLLLKQAGALLALRCGTGARALSHTHSSVAALLLPLPGLPQPAVACLSAMPWPDMLPAERPWRQQRTLDEQEFIVRVGQCFCQNMVLTAASGGSCAQSQHPPCRPAATGRVPRLGHF